MGRGGHPSSLDDRMPVIQSALAILAWPLEAEKRYSLKVAVTFAAAMFIATMFTAVAACVLLS